MSLHLRKCAFCLKDIPATIRVCPYCNRDEKGQDVSSAGRQASVPAQDPDVLKDLAALGSEDPVLRRHAADRLARHAPGVIPLLIHQLTEHDPVRTGEVAKLLGRLRDGRAAAPLLEAFKVGDENVRGAALWALSQLRDPQILDELLRQADVADAGIQGYLAHVLGGYQDPRVVPALVKLATHSKRDVSFQAIWALGDAGHDTAIPALRHLLSRKDPLIKDAAEESLRRLGGPVRKVYSRMTVTISIVGILAVAMALVWYGYR